MKEAGLGGCALHREGDERYEWELRDEGDIGLENQKAKVAWSLQFPVMGKWVQFPVQPDKATILLVAEAWHATGMEQEASRILVTINGERKRPVKKRQWKNKYQ
ncbi:hypothetical protein POTOM_026331 [Populus tomentosa]|uniref:Uncharacterized protein n=1 Tax=Populus tomentosa TaxID=118781 RepID=A0A8X7ZQR0_POPTO|nr:hypothetical protein POTOM_026331 [Populus tomentosa]